ncbi:MAG: HisA/HisF-related TIM barrel protein [Candidatus Bathyarchaeia archaeon]
MPKLFYTIALKCITEEKTVKVIPVIDILNGQVVHAIRGKRKEYQPLRSRICNSTNPLDVAATFKTLGFNELYIADLEAITGTKTNLTALKEIADNTGLKLMVDAGVDNLKKAKLLLENHISKIIIGTETLTDLNLVTEAIILLGSEKVVVSLDLMNNQLLSRLDTEPRTPPLALLPRFQEAGVSQIIILDLARVGSGEGVNMPLIEEAIRNFKGKAYVGGGIRNISDLLELERIGATGALIATALHSGKISINELEQAKLLR